ncbi:unnamed protein product [Adineta ricciae]|uniref:G-protein coupled receptors family 1 profile domain-containing protein n=1 Tax=Adineta ricciae TaxID=249248 RepID=A0A815IDI7_ADIRI|nr:unnamed protein product [Adineta ricciae]
MASLSSAEYVKLLISISNNIDLYMSITFFVFGLVNAVMVILIFTRPAFYKSPSSIYILTRAICDIILLHIVTFSRAYTGGTGINATLTNEIWCKIRASSFNLFTCFSFGCIYLNGFDQWVSTARSVQRRQWSSKKLAYVAVLILLIVLFGLIGIPMFIIYSPTATSSACTFKTTAFADYYNFFFAPMVFCALPIVIPVIFGILTYRNIRLLTNRVHRIEQQLTKMLLLHFIITSVVSIPYAIFTFYNAATLRMQKDSLRLAQEYLYSTITRNFFQVHYADTFYIFFISSSEIRETLKKNLLQMICRTRIVPVTAEMIVHRRQQVVGTTTQRSVQSIPVVYLTKSYV